VSRAVELGAALALVVGLALAGLASAPFARAALPPGFQEQVVFSGLTNPTAIRFASDGRIFVAEKRGVIKVFDNLSDSTPTVFADLNTNVYNFWDRGLLGLELHPNFPSTPYVYVLYTYDAAIGGTAPRWGTPGVYSDPCPNPPGATGDGCVVSGRLSRLQAAGSVMTGSEQVLIEDWCQQYPSHSVGALAFGQDGALYVTGGDGASFNFVDYGQDGNPLNPCGDPPGGVGATLTPPTAEGGALRSQDLRTSGDPVSLDGAILRVDPNTGAGMPDNPLAFDSDPNARRIIAYGLRNPFRFTIRPGTNEVWTGDVGWNEWEEINRVVNPTDGVVENFGWPCYEGQTRQSGYDGANLNVCEDLYGQPGAVTSPHFAYHHNNRVVPNETCPTGSSSIAGLAFEFYSGGPYPADYHGALFFADYSRDCIWVMKKDANGIPAPGLVETFVAPAANPVDVQVSPAGELYYADFDGGTIRRIRYQSANQPPVAVATANPTSGPTPLTVSFNGSGSSDPDGDAITYAWDLDGDGAYDDSTAANPTYTYTQTGSYTARLRVTDAVGAASISDPIVITAGNTPPTATIASPPASFTWKVGDVVSFSGSASDAQDGSLPPSSLSWSVILHHCPSTCHTHPLQSFPGTASASFPAPDHEYPSHLELRLTATDSGGLTDTESVLLYPQTVNLTLQTQPAGLQLALNGSAATAPFTRTVITGSTNTLSAPSPQTLSGATYSFGSWSDGGAQTHNITATATSTYTATYGGPPVNTSLPGISGAAQETKTVRASDGGWSGSTPITFTYQWQRCDTAGGNCGNVGATAKTYTLTAADVGFRMRVVVTATNPYGSSSATSGPTAVVKRRR
jgi:glucose/arabinose dehydrogenase/PKD repeat protein